MLKELTRNYHFEGKENDEEMHYFKKELGVKNLFNFLASTLKEDEEITNDQKISVFRDDKEITSFTKQDYLEENIDLTMRQLNCDVLSYNILEDYFCTYILEKRQNAKGELKDYKVKIDNLRTRIVKVIIK